MDPMQKAAKEKSFILWIVASVALFCAPSFASSVRDLPAENRVEIFLLEGQSRVGQQAFDTANRVENYDSPWGVASESLVAPKGIAHVIPESCLGHIFRDAPGHLRDTVANRRLLQEVAEDVGTTLGTDKYGNIWSARLLPDGTQAWT